MNRSKILDICRLQERASLKHADGRGYMSIQGSRHDYRADALRCQRESASAYARVRRALGIEEAA